MLTRANGSDPSGHAQIVLLQIWGPFVSRGNISVAIGILRWQRSMRVSGLVVDASLLHRMALVVDRGGGQRVLLPHSVISIDT